MARTADEHLAALLEQRDLLVDQLADPMRYRLSQREVERDIPARLKVLTETLIPMAESAVTVASRRSARNLVSFRRQ